MHAGPWQCPASRSHDELAWQLHLAHISWRELAAIVLQGHNASAHQHILPDLCTHPLGPSKSLSLSCHCDSFATLLYTAPQKLLHTFCQCLHCKLQHGRPTLHHQFPGQATTSDRSASNCNLLIHAGIMAFLTLPVKFLPVVFVRLLLASGLSVTAQTQASILQPEDFKNSSFYSCSKYSPAVDTCGKGACPSGLRSAYGTTLVLDRACAVAATKGRHAACGKDVPCCDPSDECVTGKHHSKCLPRNATGQAALSSGALCCVVPNHLPTMHGPVIPFHWLLFAHVYLYMS